MSNRHRKPTTSSFIVTLFLIAFSTIAVNAGWGGFVSTSTGANSYYAPTTSLAAAKAMTTPLNAITSFDAALVYRHEGNLTPALTADQLTVGDVSGSGSVNSFDSLFISWYVSGFTTNTGTTGTTLPSGLLMGDVSGTGPHYDGQPGTVSVSLPNMTNTGGTVLVPVYVDNVTGLGIISYDFQVTFDPAVLQPASSPTDKTGTLSGNAWYVPSNSNNPGHLIVSGWYSTPLTGSGRLINLVFNVVGAPGQSTALTFENYTDPNGRIHQSFLLNEGMPSSTTANGSFTAAAFTPTPTFTVTSTSTVTSTATSTPTATATATGTPAMPTIGNYPNTTITLGANATIVPDSAPTNAVSMSAETTTGFVGELTADPVTGVVRITNASQANIASGNYPVTVRAFGVNGVSATSSFTLTVTSGVSCSQHVLFNTPAVPWNYLNTIPASLAVGDFNNDGIQDVVTANMTDTASIRLGDGSGGFLTPAPPNAVLGTRPNSVAVGDFNGDGNQDFATSNLDSNNVSIRLGNGTGGFTLPVVPEIAFSRFPSEVFVGDFNSDGRDDLAVVNDNRVSIRLGNGASGFSSPSVPELSLPGPAISVAFGDFNNDNVPDLAVSVLTSPTSSVSIRLGDGNGGFTSPAAPEVPVGRWAGYLAVGDFNADGNQDFAVTNSTDAVNPNGTVSIRMGNGQGGFSPASVAELLVDRNPENIKIGDFNNDGIQDLAFTYFNRNKVSLRLGDGSGCFISPSIPDVFLGDNSQHVLDVAIADFNGDGIQDIATANSAGGSISTRLGACGVPTSTPTNTPTNTSTPTNTPTSTSTNTPTSTPTIDPLAVHVSLPDVSGTVGSVITIPITVGDLTGRGAISYDLQVSFDPSIITPASPAFDRTGTLCNSTWLVHPNSQNPGHLVVGAFSAGPLTGSGTLINLRFNLVGAVGESTALTFEDYISSGNGSDFHAGFVFNEGNPSSVTTNGSVTVIAPSTPTFTPTATATPSQSAISGTVTYGNLPGSPSQRPVPNVLISGVGSIPVSALTDGNGAYSLSGFGSGSYTITPSKTGDINGSITSFDAARISQHIAGINTLNPTQQVVADVSGSGSLSSFDAAMIAKYAADGPGTTQAGSTGLWQFSPASRTHQSVSLNLTNENYDALLMGDVSGSWVGSVSSRKASGPERNASVAVQSIIAQPNREILIPVRVQGVANKGVIAYEFDLRYDPSVIQPLTDPVDFTNTVSHGFSVATNAEVPGLLRVVVYGAIPITNNGTLLNLRFVAVGKSGASSSLTFGRFMFNEGEPGVSTFDGQVRLSGRATRRETSD